MDQNGYHQKIYNKKCLRGSVSSTLNISSFPFSPSFQCLDSIILFLFSPFSSVTQTCPILCDPMNCNKPGFPVHHQLLELTQTHVHRVSDAIQPSNPLSFLSPPAFNLSHQQCRQVSPFPTHSPAFIICILFDDGHSEWCEVILHYSFDLHFSNVNDVEH